MDKIFINPKKKPLQEFIDLCVATVNKRQSARTIGSIKAPDWRTFRKKQGLLRYNGGSVCGSYKYTAYSSVLEIAWWIAPDGKRHVRVEAERIMVSNDNVPKLMTGSGWARVHPERSIKLAELKADRAMKRINKLGEAKSHEFLGWTFEMSASSEEGVLICDRNARPTSARLIVKEPYSKFRNVFTAPVKFVNPKSKTYEKLGSEAARVQAAIENIKPFKS